MDNDAILDTNDAIYGGFKANDPIIVINQNAIIPKDVKETTLTSINISRGIAAFDKLFT